MHNSSSGSGRPGGIRRQHAHSGTGPTVSTCSQTRCACCHCCSVTQNAGGVCVVRGTALRDWSAIQAHLAEYDAQRETVIKRSRGEAGRTPDRQLVLLPRQSATHPQASLTADLLCCARAGASAADAQKAAKQAIYSLHRADFAKATQQLETVGERHQGGATPAVHQDRQTALRMLTPHPQPGSMHAHHPGHVCMYLCASCNKYATITATML